MPACLVPARDSDHARPLMSQRNAASAAVGLALLTTACSGRDGSAQSEALLETDFR